MPAMNHLHTYARFRSAKKKMPKYGGIYRCTHPDCTHKLTHFDLNGKRARCSKCGEQFIVEAKFHFHLSNLICLACSNDKRAKQKNTATELADSILRDVQLKPHELQLPEMEIVLEEPKPEEPDHTAQMELETMEDKQESLFEEVDR